MREGIRSIAIVGALGLASAGLSGCDDSADIDAASLSGAMPTDRDTPTRDDSMDDPMTDPVVTPGMPALARLECDRDAPATTAGREDVVTQSTDIDGNTIDVAITVFTPELDAGECAPLIVHSHGFGGSRLTDLESVPDDANASDLATRDAWRSGYFVVSFDQRGFGETGGLVMVENPDFEGQDTRAVVDYAVDNLGGHLGFRQGDPAIGGLGLSYGGGFQLVGSGVDPRFDAIVPAATWYGLPYSLNSNDVPKTYWLDLLGLIGATGANFALDPFLYQGILQTQFGNISDAVVEEVRGNGLNAFCEELRPSEGVPEVDAFLVQGASDTLFNLNEAERNAECLRSAGNDVRVLVQNTGHILPLFQQVQGAFGFDLDPRVACGEERFDTSERMLSFLDEKLRGEPARPAIADYCFSQSENQGIVTDRFPVGGTPYTIPTTSFTTGPVLELVTNVLQGLNQNGTNLLATLVESLGTTVSNLLDTVGNLVTNPTELPSILTNDVLALLPPELLNELTSPARELFLFTADRPMTLAGIPTAELTLESAGNDPIVFVGLGLKRAGENRIALINDQVAPLRGTGDYDQELVGVSARVMPGDEVYLLAYGFNNQYFLSFNRIPRSVELSGQVSLPLIEDRPAMPAMTAGVE